jgi:hypothetical protein
MNSRDKPKIEFHITKADDWRKTYINVLFIINIISMIIFTYFMFFDEPIPNSKSNLSLYSFLSCGFLLFLSNMIIFRKWNKRIILFKDKIQLSNSEIINADLIDKIDIVIKEHYGQYKNITLFSYQLVNGTNNKIKIHLNDNRKIETTFYIKSRKSRDNLILDLLNFRQEYSIDLKEIEG